MNITFRSDDSLYKIFSTLKKVPPYKKVTVTFPDRHEIFNHPRRWKQLQELVTEYHLDIRFMVSSREHSNYFKSIGFEVLYDKPHSWFTKIFYEIQKIVRWDTPWTHKKVVSWLIVIAEIAVFILLWSFFRWVISPKATITITPNARIRPITYRYLLYPISSGYTNDSIYTSPLTIPYEKVLLEYTTSLGVNIADITYTTTPAKWSITITNTLPTPYSLLVWTQFITDQWFIYRSDDSIEIEAWSVETPSITTALLTADPVSESWIRQWEEANILMWTRMRIRNLSESIVMQWIWWESNDDFVWWSIEAVWVVSQEDIEELKQELIATMDENKKNYLNEATQSESDFINLPFDQFIAFKPLRFETDAQQWDDLIQIEWTVTWELTYHRISRDNLLKAMQSYMQQRPLIWYQLLDTDTWSLRIYDLINTPTTWQYYMPTRLNTIWWYDFTNDENGIRSEIVQRIAWTSRNESSSIILSYDQVLDTEIKISPPWYDTLPESVERITVKGIDE